jgi:peptidoglycan/LPS O-acetylase OafA/YrhL
LFNAVHAVDITVALPRISKLMLLLNSRRIEKRSPFDICTLLNFSKGISIIFIFLVHYQMLGFGWQAVHLFIIFSGFCLTYSRLEKGNLPWQSWYFKRLRRILPTYFVVVIFGYFFVALLIMLRGASLLESLWMSKRTLLFDLSLLKNFSYEQISTFPNVSLWFIPFIISFYSIFPFLYQWMTQRRGAQHLLVVLISAIFIEIIFRASAIYWLDGKPIGYSGLESLFAENLFPTLALPFNKIPDSAAFPFQLEAPFGFFPSRIGEFAIGMVAAICYVANRDRFNRIVLSRQAGILGILIWLLANVLISTSFWGWVIGDLLIAVGLSLWVLGLARVAATQPIFSRFFGWMSQVGVFSYYIFLVHAIFIQVFIAFIESFAPEYISVWKLPLPNLIILAVMIALTAVASKLLQQFDRSKFTDWIMQQTFGRLLGVPATY